MIERRWHEFIVRTVKLKDEERAEKLGIEAPEPTDSRAMIDLNTVANYWESETEDGKPATSIETVYGSYSALIPFDEFRALMEAV